MSLGHPLAKALFLKNCFGCVHQLAVKIILDYLGKEIESTEYSDGVSCREVIINTIVLKSLGVKVSRQA